MSATATTLASALIEAWTPKRFQQQFNADDGPIQQFKALPATMIGSQASTSVWSDLNSGGYTSTSVAGGALNTATNQPVAKALWTMSQHFMPISTEIAVFNQVGGGLQSTVDGKNLEIEGALATLNNQLTRQAVTNGDGIVAQCDTANTTTVALRASPSGLYYGYDAIVRNWLRPNAVVDIGTTSDTDALATATTVTAVSESASAPTITVAAGTLSTTAGTHFVYIANPNSATAANPEINGLRNIVAATGALGGLNPATAGQEFWQAASRDTSTTVLSLDLLLNLSRAVRQKSGQAFTDLWFGLKQESNYYSLLQNQVRFSGDSVSAGNVGSATWNGMRPKAFPAILDSDVYVLTLDDFVRVTGKYTEPTWISQIEGSSQASMWNQGNTNFVDSIFYALQLGIKRRNTHAAATGLTA